jgi:DNA-binding transcriptional regulator PaaX
VNTTSDAFSQLATVHSASEIAYFRVLLNAIFDTANSVEEEIFAIRSMDAAYLTSSPGVGLTKSAGETALQKFVREGWLDKSRAGFYSLSERGLLELKGYLLEMFNDPDEETDGDRSEYIRTCHACQEIVTKVSLFVIW